MDGRRMGRVVLPESHGEGYYEGQGDASWMGKQKTGKKGGEGKGKGKGACYFCGNGGHTKNDCRSFVKHKKDEDAARAAKRGHSTHVHKCTPKDGAESKGVTSLEVEQKDRGQ